MVSHFTVEGTKPGKFNRCKVAVIKPEQESSSPECILRLLPHQMVLPLT